MGAHAGDSGSRLLDRDGFGGSMNRTHAVQEKFCAQGDDHETNASTWVKSHVLVCSVTIFCKQACVFARICHVTAPRRVQCGAGARCFCSRPPTSTDFELSRMRDNSQKTAVGPYNIGTLGLTLCHIAPWRYRAHPARAESGLPDAVGLEHDGPLPLMHKVWSRSTAYRNPS